METKSIEEWIMTPLETLTETQCKLLTSYVGALSDKACVHFQIRVPEVADRDTWYLDVWVWRNVKLTI